jgi:hypothetical protein
LTNTYDMASRYPRRPSKGSRSLFIAFRQPRHPVVAANCNIILFLPIDLYWKNLWWRDCDGPLQLTLTEKRKRNYRLAEVTVTCKVGAMMAPPGIAGSDLPRLRPLRLRSLAAAAAAAVAESGFPTGSSAPADGGPSQAEGAGRGKPGRAIGSSSGATVGLPLRHDRPSAAAENLVSRSGTSKAGAAGGAAVPRQGRCRTTICFSGAKYGSSMEASRPESYEEKGPSRAPGSTWAC